MTNRTRLVSAVTAAAREWGVERYRYARPDDYGRFQSVVRSLAPTYSATRHPRLTQLLWAEWADAADCAERAYVSAELDECRPSNKASAWLMGEAAAIVAKAGSR